MYTLFDAASLELLEKEVSYFQNFTLQALKNNISWMNSYVKALYDDLGVVIIPEDRLGFSPRRLLEKERRRAYRIMAAIATIKADGYERTPNKISGMRRAIHDSQANVNEMVDCIQTLYYQLEDEFRDKLRELGDKV